MFIKYFLKKKMFIKYNTNTCAFVGDILVQLIGRSLLDTQSSSRGSFGSKTHQALFSILIM